MHLRDVGTGDTRPQLYLCDHDGHEERWALKLMGLASSELVADWVGSLLAHRLGIRCPAVAIADVRAAALDVAPEAVRQWARPGPAFASKWIEQAFSGATDADMLDFPPDDLGAMYALDAWLEVLDRRKPDGIWNIIKDTGDNALWVLDFGKGMTPCFGYVIGGDTPIPPDYPERVRQAASLDAALQMCALIEAIAESEISEIVASVPAEWADDATRARVIRFPCERSGAARAICQAWLGGGV